MVEIFVGILMIGALCVEGLAIAFLIMALAGKI